MRLKSSVGWVLSSMVRGQEWLGDLHRPPPLTTLGANITVKVAACNRSMCDCWMINWWLLTLTENDQMSTDKVDIIFYWDDVIKTTAIPFFFKFFIKIHRSEADCVFWFVLICVWFVSFTAICFFYISSYLEKSQTHFACLTYMKCAQNLPADVQLYQAKTRLFSCYSLHLSPSLPFSCRLCSADFTSR